MSGYSRHAADVESASATTPLLSRSRDISPSSSVTMPITSHVENHSDCSQYIKDGVIGFADGLTVPFALTAGLSAVGSSRLVIIGGLAELFAGMISMGLGAWLGSVTETKHYEVELERERREVRECPQREEEEIFEIFDKYRIPHDVVVPIVEGFKKDHDAWVEFMMDFEIKVEKPRPNAAKISALVMGLSYFIGGFFPLLPYFIIGDLHHALFTSIGVSILVLLVFGYVKAAIIGTKRWDAIMSALQTLLVGVAAAATSYAIVRTVNERFGDVTGY